MRRVLTVLATATAAALPAFAGPLGSSAAVPRRRSSRRRCTPPSRPIVSEASTTIAFGFHLQTATGLAPPPLTSIVLHMPAGMDYTHTTLGLATCQTATLQANGVKGCPPNSRLGSGGAFVEVPFGTGSGHELPEIQAVSGPPSSEGNMVVLFYANGQFPVSAQLVFSGEVLRRHGRVRLTAGHERAADSERAQRAGRLDRGV